VWVYDFIDKTADKGRVTPYGVYDLTASFTAAESAANTTCIERWHDLKTISNLRGRAISIGI
jgi:hypothetical protein